MMLLPNSFCKITPNLYDFYRTPIAFLIFLKNVIILLSLCMDFNVKQISRVLKLDFLMHKEEIQPIFFRKILQKKVAS